MKLQDLLPTLELVSDIDDMNDKQAAHVTKIFKVMFSQLSEDDKHLARLLCNAQSLI